MTYDTDGNLTSITDPEGNLTQFTGHDIMGNVLTKIDARNKTWTYTYDAKGQLKTITDPLMNVTSFDYDAVGNITKITYPGSFVVNYSYDNYCRTPVPGLYLSKMVSQVEQVELDMS